LIESGQFQLIAITGNNESAGKRGYAST